ncbi:hypothetical protein, partial [Dolichospermum sp. UHCC 0299]|uniref:hypothetical protein n=1 Tax=Dolichospermum sp. UHCC 0299 TaxID=2590014 RepID=UPI001C2BA7CD
YWVSAIAKRSVGIAQNPLSCTSLEGVWKVMVDVSNIFYPTLTLPFTRGGNWIFIVSPQSIGGTKGGSNVMKITEYHFSNILLTGIDCDSVSADLSVR